MVDVKQQHWLGIRIFELIIRLLLPALRQIFRSIDVLGEKAILVGNAQVIEHGLDHVQVRNQDGLRKIGREIFVAFAQARPEARRRLTQALGVHLGQVHARLQTIEKLKGLELADRNSAQQLSERLLAQALEDLGKLHKKPA